ncbi:MAG: PP2C family protein-serine/threonine phosphatase [Alphaproteobacteria bacterium]|jgi:sigma-B regulation protein RsbU (phosphoserine phosphatase)|nr:PP2C family protein-serine/threonine phosphatase [Alphaproteobacteria bacterium]
MWQEQRQDRDQDPARSVAQLHFAAAIGDRLALAEAPLATLEAALPEIAAHLGVDAGHLRVEVVGNDLALTTEIAADGEIGDADRAFLDVLAQLARLAPAKAALESRLAEQHGLGRDLQRAAELQQNLQPDSAPDDLPIWGLNLPARQLSGDFFDYFRLDDARIAFSLGDVSGKGINAALLMAKTASLFRYLGKRMESPAALLATVNDELCETATRGMFVTMVAGHYCPLSGEVTFANAGHQPPLLRRPDRSYDTFPATAPPLGILPATEPSEQRIDLAGGELYLFSDGLTEYRYADGELLGVEGLIQLVELFAEESPAQRLKLILETLDQGGWEVRDDLTVLAIDDAWVRHTGIDAGQASTNLAEAV